MIETKKPRTQTTFSVYIAASSEPLEIVRAQRWTARLKEAGISVVSTWSNSSDLITEAPFRDTSDDKRCCLAAQALHEVSRANALWLMCPPPGVSTPTPWVELGVAYIRAMLIVSSGDTRQLIFTALGVECANDEKAFESLCSAASIFDGL